MVNNQIIYEKLLTHNNHVYVSSLNYICVTTLDNGVHMYIGMKILTYNKLI